MIEIKENNVLVFDLDGTIANTEKYHWKAHNKVLSAYGIKLNENDIKKYIGKNDIQIYSSISKDFGVDINLDEIINNKVDTFIDMAKKYDIKPFPEIEKIIRSSKNAKYLLTSQNPKIVNFLLEKWDMSNLFSEIISLANTNKTKLECLRELPYSKSFIISFEDSPTIIKEFRDNGYCCVAVINEYNRDELINMEYYIAPLEN